MTPRVALGALSALLLLLVLPASAAAVQPVSGVVFNDYNANGVRDGGGGATGVARDGGVRGVTVTAYGPGGGVVASAVSGADGGYTLEVPDGVPLVRVEFTDFPPGYLSGPHGPNSGTTVQFVDLTDAEPDTGVSLGIAVPEDYCANAPLLAVSCFRFGPAIAGTPSSPTASVIGLPYSPPGLDFTPDSPALTLATHQQVGAVWGGGFDSGTGDLYVGAYFKVHSGFGPGGPGAIYRIPFTGTGATGYGPPVLWATLGATLNAHTPSTDPEDWVADGLPESFDAVGKTGLGDLDVAPDGSELYAVDLENRVLDSIPLGGATGAPSSSVAIPAPAGCPAADWRPFAVAVRRGSVYVGGVCSAQSVQSADSPSFQAHVLRYDPDSDSFEPTPVLSFPLNPAAFPRKCADRADNRRGFEDNENLLSSCPLNPANWNPWVDDEQAPTVSGFPTYPQPMLTDIAFDGDAMVLGMRDRWGDQMGNQAYGPDYPFNESLMTGIPAGDLLRACRSGSGWVLESNASCGGVTGNGAGNAEGPGGGEFYSSDDWVPHDQLGLGGVVQVPGFDENVTTMFDPLNPPDDPGDDGFNDGGVVWSSNTLGGRTRNGFRVYDDDTEPPETIFAKANGLGDLEALCRQAPLEIGNRVWLDTNRDGIQGAERDEPAIEGVVVELWRGGERIAETTTDARGEYYFTGLTPNSGYEVRINLAQAVLAPYRLTGFDQGPRNTIDSDGRPSGDYAIATLTTGGPGDNDHTWDFGFYESSDTELTKRPSKTVVRVGEELSYRIEVVNRGPGTARDVVIQDTLPDIVRYISIRISQGTCTGEREITCRVGDLAAGESVVAVLRVEAVRAGSTENFAVVEHESHDPEPDNNRCCEGPRPPTVAKRADRRSALAGSRVRYTITVRNRSRRLAARNFLVCDRLGRGMRFVAVPRARFRRGEACWRVRRLGPRQRRTFRTVARVRRDVTRRRSVNTAIVGRRRARVSVTLVPRRPPPAPPVTG